MIDNILDLSRIEGRLLDLEDENVSLREAIEAAAREVTGARPEDAPILIDVPVQLPLLRVDPRRLQQIIKHLLSNAVKFTPKDGRIEVRALQLANGGIAIVIKDTGIGMEPDRIGYALEPFKQLDSRLERRFEGGGLGLPLANALIGLHGGRLSIESRPGAGTTVTGTFPPDRTVQTVRAARV
jgi:signal transduction histidine kinase